MQIYLPCFYNNLFSPEGLIKPHFVLSDQKIGRYVFFSSFFWPWHEKCCLSIGGLKAKTKNTTCPTLIKDLQTKCRVLFPSITLVDSKQTPMFCNFILGFK